jgi:hypothetical protein
LPLVYLVTATGGAPGPFTFTVTAGALPHGLTLEPDGTLSGTPTQVGTFPFTIMATDSDNDEGIQAYTLSVTAVPTSIAVSASSTSSVYGQIVTFTATVTTPAGAAIPTSSAGIRQRTRPVVACPHRACWVEPELYCREGLTSRRYRRPVPKCRFFCGFSRRKRCP